MKEPTPEELRACWVAVRGGHSVLLNMNDTFAFASADVEEISTDDILTAAPIFAKYGNDALTAYAAVRRGYEPIDCRCNHKNDNYKAAKLEIEELKKTEKYFCLPAGTSEDDVD
jgi:hypothetical protein